MTTVPTPPTRSKSLPAGGAAWKIAASVATSRGRKGERERELAEKATESAVYRLRAQVRRLTVSDRTRGCGVRCVRGDGAEIEVRRGADGPRARWLGIMRCEHRWTCPVCARRIIARRRQQIMDAVRRGAEVQPGRRWIMLTLTVRHDAGLPLAESLGGLLAAWRATRQRGTIQRAWRAHVRASARALEVTDGPHGWHPHLHLIILTDSWDAAELDALRVTWREMVTRELGERCAPDLVHGMRWSGASTEAYLAKLGLEMTGAAKVGSAWGHVAAASEHYALARLLSTADERERATARAHAHHARWTEYERATKGRRAIELDDRAARLAVEGERIRLAEDAHAASVELASPTWSVEVTSDDLSAIRYIERRELGALLSVLRIAEAAPDPSAARCALDTWIRARL